MVDIKKAIVKAVDLPPLTTIVSRNELGVSTTSIGYYTRFRITSEDKNQYSHWSPIYAVKVPAITLLGEVQVIPSAKTITAIWGDELAPGITRPNYDVFVRWGNKVSHAESVGTLKTITTHVNHSFVNDDVIKVEFPESFSDYAKFNGTHTVVAKTADTISYLTSTSDNINHSFGSTVASVAFAEYYYHGTAPTHTYSFLRTGNVAVDGSNRDLSTFDYIHVDIQIASIAKKYSSYFLIYDTPIGMSLT